MDYPEFEKRILKTLCQFTPIQSTYLGIHKWDHVLDDVSPTGLQFTKQVFEKLLNEIIK